MILVGISRPLGQKGETLELEVRGEEARDVSATQRHCETILPRPPPPSTFIS